YHVTGTAAATITTIGGLTAATSRPPAPPGLPPPTRSHPERVLIDIVWKGSLELRDAQKR
ncbi:hypothetical protein, partial [Flexivirga sp.]|uniref:hypothetical protein n=1 Tax=Flexivirga sp. TaxID=1962927 RepID=UPI003F7E8574